MYAAIALCLCIVSYLGLSQRQRDVVARRLRLRKRRLSSANTPPRSLSPENKVPSDATPKANEYVRQFPPSQRHVLEELAQSLPSNERQALGDLSFDQETFARSILGWEEDYRKADPAKYVYTGFSIKEIKALGDFPDYATLSGVPLPRPYNEFNLETARARPYRPLRWAYHQTMSLTKMETDWWLELESTYKSRIEQRKSLYAQHGDSVLQWLPGSELASKELMEMALQFYCSRHPQYFSLSPSPSDASKTIFENRILGTTQVVQDKHPLLVLLDNVPEDFAIMLRNPQSGYYHFRSGVICSALGWNTGSKIGKQLHEIHAPIPDYKEKMQFSMDRFFTKMPADKPIQRGSWGLEVDEPLYMPPGDPHEKYREVQAPDLTLDRLHLRVDWQTLRRLPLSGAIIFNFKALFTPVADFRHEPYIPSLALKVIKDGKENLMKYKNTWHTEHVAIPALEEFQKEQIEKGMIEKDWEVQTLDQSPFYPSWEELWHHKQGF